jgi:hypothetical protein
MAAAEAAGQHALCRACQHEGEGGPEAGRQGHAKHPAAKKGNTEGAQQEDLH